MFRIAGILLILTSLPGFFQDPDQSYPVGRNVSPPKVLRKVDPQYSREAEAEKIQGTALYSLVVDKSGKPRDIELISPIGYGLDEAGREAISKWTFEPGVKDGKPVNVRATIEVNFRMPSFTFDTAREKQRTTFNAAIHDMSAPATSAKGIEQIQKLSGEKFPPAMSLLGQWMMDGQNVPKDFAGGAELVKKAANKYDGRGLYVLGIMYTNGVGVPADPEKGLKMIRDASVRGNNVAQLYLGIKYENGDGLPATEPGRASNYFRLCAARGVAQCQYHLGKSLAPRPTGGGDLIQAVAWLELARDGSVADAEPLLVSLRGSLSDEDLQRAEKLKAQLLRH